MRQQDIAYAAEYQRDIATFAASRISLEGYIHSRRVTEGFEELRMGTIENRQPIGEPHELAALKAMYGQLEVAPFTVGSELFMSGTK